MEKFSREELVVKSAVHFKNMPEENSILACEDGQFFLNNATSEGQLATHCKDNDLKSFVIERAEATGVKVAKSSSKEVQPVDLSKMTLAQLTEEATKKGIEVPEGATKKEIVELIETAQTPKGEVSAEGN